MPKFNPKIEKYIRPAIALIIIALGGVFMLIPFIPLGYILIFIGLFLLSSYLPFVNKWIKKLKRKDDSDTVDRVEGNIIKSEEKLNSWLTKDSDNEKKHKDSKDN